jgi:hypothetical protein
MPQIQNPMPPPPKTDGERAWQKYAEKLKEKDEPEMSNLTFLLWMVGIVSFIATFAACMASVYCAQ